jgi:cytochrome b6
MTTVPSTTLPILEFMARRLSTILALVILTLTLVAGLTGILMAFYYQPAAISAHSSLQFIDQQVNYGWLIHRVHDLAGNFLVGLGAAQIVTMFLGQRNRFSWITAWFSGILFTVTAIGLGWTAMILDWSQIGYWRLNVELRTISSIPFIGETIKQILTGGSISSQTIVRMFTLHSYVLSLGAVVLAVVHLTSLLYQERQVTRDLYE